MSISPNLYGRLDGSKFWRFPWFPANFLLCVIKRYTVYVQKMYLNVFRRILGKYNFQSLKLDISYQEKYQVQEKKYQVPTLYNVLLRIARKLLETRENIKILTNPVYHTNLDWFSWEWSKKKFEEKKFKMADFSKWPFFKTANSRDFFAKISQIRPWVSRIDWCEAH